MLFPWTRNSNGKQRKWVEYSIDFYVAQCLIGILGKFQSQGSVTLKYNVYFFVSGSN